MFDELGRAVKEVGAVDPAALTDAELTDAVLELHRATAALESAKARLGAAWDLRRPWAADGAKSGAAWLATTTGAPKAECASSLRLGRRLQAMPVVAAAWEAGEITTAHVRRLAGANNRRAAAAFRRDEVLLVDQARSLRFSEFEQALDYWLLHADPDGAEEADVERRERRRVSFDRTVGGMGSGSILLDPIAAEIFATELERLEQQLFESDWAEAKSELGRDPVAAELARSGDQRRADALVQMAVRSAAAGPGASTKPLFTVLLGSDQLSHLCQLASGHVLPPAALLPWISSADLERVLFDGGAERVIKVSRRRRFEGALRRLIEVRDRFCYHQFCDEPSHRCQVDHVQRWTDGGMTSQDNGRLACGFHNRLRNRPPPRRE